MYDTKTAIVLILTLIIMVYWNMVLSTKFYQLKKAMLIYMRGPGYKSIIGYNSGKTADADYLLNFVEGGKENFSCGYRNYYENPCNSTPYFYMHD
jgi:hypothetical protein